MHTKIVRYEDNFFTLDGLQSLLKEPYNPSKATILNASELMEMTPSQVIARTETIERWHLSQFSSANFLRCIDENLTRHFRIDINRRNQVLFRKSIIQTLNQFSTKLIDLKYDKVTAINIRFDGSINDKAGLFLIEMPIHQITEFITSVKQRKAIHSQELISFQMLLDFYTTTENSPFFNIKLDDYRYIYLPYNDLIG